MGAWYEREHGWINTAVLPKNRDLTTITQQEISMAMERLNNPAASCCTPILNPRNAARHLNSLRKVAIHS